MNTLKFLMNLSLQTTQLNAIFLN